MNKHLNKNPDTVKIATRRKLFMLFSRIVFETKMMIILCLAESKIEEYGYQIGAKKNEKKGEERV